MGNLRSRDGPTGSIDPGGPGTPCAPIEPGGPGAGGQNQGVQSQGLNVICH